MVEHSSTSLTPPRLASLPVERHQLEFSSRSLVVVADGPRLLRAWGPPRRPWIVGVEAHGHRWQIEAWGAGPREARAAVRAMFSLAHPLEEFYRLVRREPALRGTEIRFRGLRLPRDANLYEAFLHSILGQQLSVAAANTLKRRLFELTGAFLTADRQEVPFVPPPDRLAALGPVGLRELGISRAKSTAIAHLGNEVDRIEGLAPELARASVRDAIAKLVELPGVGRWTAENVLLRGVGRPDVFVAGDLGLRVALDEFGVVPRTDPEALARSWAARYYPGWGSYATLYLWRKLVAGRRAEAG